MNDGIETEGDRLWFGTTYYAGEGQTGVGGFGYFDAVAGAFRLIPAPGLA